MEKISGERFDLRKENIEYLKRIFPECVSDGKINFEILRAILGDETVSSNEKYSFEWNGKVNSIKSSLEPSNGTLTPCKEKSLNWDNTENIYIEGDNLETMKVLLKTYFAKIKMIYIDPPYNTGKDFVYHDDFSDNIENYLKISKQEMKANPESNGRFHTDWLNMISSRLRIARSLLSNDGVIFISIDDNEQANLLKIATEIFGDNNFICIFPRITKKGGKSTDKYAKNHDFILAFAKNIDEIRISGIGHIDDGFKNKDEYFEKRGPYKLNQTLDYNSLQYNTTMDYVIELNGKQYVPGGSMQDHINRHNGIHGAHDWVWRWSKKLFDFGLKNGWIEISKSGRIYTKTYLNASIEKDSNDEYYISYIDRTKPLSTLEFVDNIYSNDNATKEFYNLMGASLFDYVKPTSLLMQLMRTCTDKNSIIMDFFSGSGTTADAVLKLNAEDGGNRKFIVVQLPEVCQDGTEAKKAGYDNICDIGEERIRRAAKKIDEECKSNQNVSLFESNDNNIVDLGFKVFKLQSSNIKGWDSSQKLDETTLLDQLETIKENRTNLDVAYEIMLLYGVFNMPLKEVMINNKSMFNVGKGFLIIDLNDEITSLDVETIGKEKPHCVVFKESSFKDDNTKLNTVKTLKTFGVQDIKCL